MSGLQPGEPIPECLLPATHDRPAETLYARFCGAPLRVIALTAASDLPEVDGPVLWLVPPSVALPATRQTVLTDDGRILQALCGLTYAALRGPTAWQFDARLRLIGEAAPGANLAAGSTRPQHVHNHAAPVLMLPKVLSPALCTALMEAHRQDHFESGVNRRGADGETRLIADPLAKSRRDHRLVDPQLMSAVTEALQRRVLPALNMAFSAQANRFEAFKVVAYHSATGGYFRRHRDNIAPETRHRRFALTVNLNDGYRGGHLLFPEFSDDGYAPLAGGAVLFSGSLLHEVADVTEGKRYALISFLWHDGRP